MSDYSDKILYGKSQLQRLVSLEPKDDLCELFIQNDDGSVRSEFVKNRYWILSNVQISEKFARLDGNLHYKWGTQFSNKRDFIEAQKNWRLNHDIYCVYNDKEALMILDGYTLYKGLKPKEVSILSFDIETTGLFHNKDSKVLLISNTFRNNDKIIKKLFSYDDYTNEGEMIEDWCNWIREMNPSILLGYNILAYDLPYLNYIANKYNVSLDLGRDDSPLKFGFKESNFRLDGTRELKYKKVQCYGREIIDLYMVTYKYDVNRKLTSYGLKTVIKELGLEKTNRSFYDASQIRFKYKDPVEFQKIKNYAIDDSDDSLNLYDTIIDSTFYSTQNIPKPISDIVTGSQGSQINSILCRAYLQDSHSIPKKTENSLYVEGGISIGIPKVYKNVIRWDLKSAYPSQILRFQLHDKEKDPKKYFYYIVKKFTEERFEMKRLSKTDDTGYYSGRDAASKIFINSSYGLLNAQGLNFNSPVLAAKITKETRNVIEQVVQWATGKDLEYWRNQCPKD